MNVTKEIRIQDCIICKNTCGFKGSLGFKGASASSAVCAYLLLCVRFKKQD
jgi:hypothetical protein